MLEAAGVDAGEIRAYLLNIIRCRKEQMTWYKMSKRDFEDCRCKVSSVPIAVLAGKPEDINVNTPLGEFSVKYRYVIPVQLHSTHMNVLVLGTSGGTGGQYLIRDRKLSCIGFKRDGDCKYDNLFQNPPVEIPADTKYPLAKCPWTNLTYTVPINYDSRVSFTADLPESEAKYVMRLYNYFRAKDLLETPMVHW